VDVFVESLPKSAKNLNFFRCFNLMSNASTVHLHSFQSFFSFLKEKQHKNRTFIIIPLIFGQEPESKNPFINKQNPPGERLAGNYKKDDLYT
jgi:hypothetical protein